MILSPWKDRACADISSLFSLLTLLSEDIDETELCSYSTLLFPLSCSCSCCACSSWSDGSSELPYCCPIRLFLSMKFLMRLRLPTMPAFFMRLSSSFYFLYCSSIALTDFEVSFWIFTACCDTESWKSDFASSCLTAFYKSPHIASPFLKITDLAGLDLFLGNLS